MASRSRFSKGVSQAPSGRKLTPQVVRDMRGLNSTDPYTILENYASPYLRNARMYSSETERQVAISTRNGSDFFSVPIGEGIDVSQTSTAGAATSELSRLTYVAQRFTAASSEVLTAVDVRINSNTASPGTSPVIVEIRSDSSGAPGAVIATSSLLGSDIDTASAYVQARFVDTPLLTAASDYYIVTYIQTEDDDESYALTTTTNTTDGVVSVNGGNTWVDQAYSVNFRVYTATPGETKNGFVWRRENADDVYFLVHNTDIYTVDPVDGSTTSVASGLDANATRYRFAVFDGAVFVANGVDSLMRSTGGAFAAVSGLTTIPSHVVSHKNRLWIVDADDPTRIEFSNIGDYNTWEGLSFVYIPEPNSGDPIAALISFQDTLVVPTRRNKFVVYGYDLATLEVRQSLGKEGAISQEGVAADENYIFFISPDRHVYRWNGSDDEQLSRVIQADLDDIADVDASSLSIFDDRVYYWFQKTGTVQFNQCFVYEKRYKEWFYDEGRGTKFGLTTLKGEDNFIMGSGSVGALYIGEIGFSDMGKPIAFEYFTTYYDFGAPDNYKQVRRLYVHLRRADWNGSVTVGVDADFSGSPTEDTVNVFTSGSIWGEVTWGSFTWGGGEQYVRYRTTVPGQHTNFQVRISKTGVDTPVYFIAYSMHIRLKRPAR